MDPPHHRLARNRAGHDGEIDGASLLGGKDQIGLPRRADQAAECAGASKLAGDAAVPAETWRETDGHFIEQVVPVAHVVQIDREARPVEMPEKRSLNPLGTRRPQIPANAQKAESAGH
jgi:hypothetical protein